MDHSLESSVSRALIQLRKAPDTDLNSRQKVQSNNLLHKAFI